MRRLLILALFSLALVGCSSGHKTPTCSALVGQQFGGPVKVGDAIAPISCDDPGHGKVAYAFQNSCLYYVQLQSDVLMYAKPGEAWASMPSVNDPNSHNLQNAVAQVCGS